MIRLLVHLAALPFCLTELPQNRVHQTPTAVIKHAGEVVVMNCSHSNTNFNMIQWYKQSAGKNDMVLVGYVQFTSAVVEAPFKDTYEVSGNGGSLASLHIPKLSGSEDSAVYFCAAGTINSEAYFGQGTKLTVLEPGRNITKPRVKVLPPSERECRSQKDDSRKKTIVCVASGFYPDHVSVYWQVDGDNVTNGVATDNDALREGDFYRITSRLKVSGDDWFTLDKNFTCIVKFFNGIETSSHKDTVLGDEAEERAYYLKISKTAKVSYALLIIKSSLYGAFVAFLVWKLQCSTGKRNN